MRRPSSHRDPTRRQFIGTVLGASFALPAWALNPDGHHAATYGE